MSLVNVLYCFYFIWNHYYIFTKTPIKKLQCMPWLV